MASLPALSEVRSSLVSEELVQFPQKNVAKVWQHLPSPDRKLLVVAGSALGIGMIVGGMGVFLYRQWTDKLNEQVEVLSKSLGDVYNELRSLQQGMVKVQQSITLIHREPEDGPGKRRRPRRMQFYDSDSDESSMYFSAAEEFSEKRPMRSILKKAGLNGTFEPINISCPQKESTGASSPEPSKVFSLNGYGPESPLRSPSDDEDYYEDAVQGLEEVPSQSLIFEREYERGDLKLPKDRAEAPTPYDELDFILDSSVTNEQVISALELIQSKEQLFQNHPEYLWRLAKATFIYANQCMKHDRETRTRLIRKAKEYADMARKISPKHPDVLKWSALTTGGLARYCEKTQKLNLGLLTRQFLQSALEIRPADASLHHILGRWNYEISNLGWFERTAARAIFGSYASVSYEDAKNCFLEAERLKPRVFKSNMFYIAKCFAQQGQKDEAKKWLEDALKVERLCVEDELCDTDIQELMATL